MSELCIYFLAFLIRVVLLVYGEWQDAHMEVKFTDVDYFVLSDAAEFVAAGESPYRRATYRYSPLFAWILVPNVYLHKVWGKILFVGFDFLTAKLIKTIFDLLSCERKLKQVALCFWLFNPITFTVSCRGNAESILSTLVLGVLLALLTKKLFVAGMLFATAVHLKIYPAIFTPCIFLFLGGSMCKGNGEILLKDYPGLLKLDATVWKKLVVVERLKFFASSISTFLTLFSIMYLFYGQEFLVHTYLYHVSRRDVRHNFSMYFYMLYINNNAWLSLLCFLNQFFIILCVSYMNYEDPPFCFFLLTYAFVTFNKVCTSQYFLWYLCLIPLTLPGLYHVSLRRLCISATLWILGQGLWLYPAYLLEFGGVNTFAFLWLSGVIFFIINCSLINIFIALYDFKPLFDSAGHLKYLSKKKL